MNAMSSKLPPLLRLPDEILSQIFGLYYLDFTPHEFRVQYTRATIPRVDSLTVDVKISWLVPTALSPVCKKFHDIAEVACFVQLEELTLDDVLSSGRLKSECFLPSTLTSRLQSVRFFSLSVKKRSFQHPTAIEKSLFAILDALLVPPARVQILRLYGVPPREEIKSRLLKRFLEYGADNAIKCRIIISDPEWDLSFMRKLESNPRKTSSEKQKSESDYRKIERRMANALVSGAIP